MSKKKEKIFQMLVSALKYASNNTNMFDAFRLKIYKLKFYFVIGKNAVVVHLFIKFTSTNISHKKEHFITMILLAKYLFSFLF